MKVKYLTISAAALEDFVKANHLAGEGLTTVTSDAPPDMEIIASEWIPETRNVRFLVQSETFEEVSAEDFKNQKVPELVVHLTRSVPGRKRSS